MASDSSANLGKSIVDNELKEQQTLLHGTSHPRSKTKNGFGHPKENL